LAVATVQQTFADAGITREEWAWVQDLIGDVQRDGKREAFAKSLFQWDLAVQQFRKIELRRIILQPPSEADLRYHAWCLHALLAIGHALVIQARGFKPEDLDRFSVKHEEIEAYVTELEQSFREWHHGFTPGEVGHATREILGAKA
jgi:hypothetical protein